MREPAISLHADSRGPPGGPRSRTSTPTAPRKMCPFPLKGFRYQREGPHSRGAPRGRALGGRLSPGGAPPPGPPPPDTASRPANQSAALSPRPETFPEQVP